jgi:hypothetical protein
MLPRTEIHFSHITNLPEVTDKKYLKGKVLKDSMIQLAHYLSGRRVYKALYGERPPKAPELQSLWKGLKPN